MKDLFQRINSLLNHEDITLHSNKRHVWLNIRMSNPDRVKQVVIGRIR